MRDARIEHVVLRRPDLRTRFPRRFAARLEGRTVLAVERRAKYLLVPVSSGETLIMHLGMSGSFRIETGTDGGDRVERDRHDHVIFDLSSGAAVVFNDPRRFGFMDLAAPGSADGSPHDQHARTRAAVSGVRRAGARPRVRGKEDVAQGSAPGSTRRRWSRQHLCQRSAARGRAVARAAGENDRDTSGHAARRRVSADGGDQAGAGARDRARLRRQLPWRAVSRLRPRGRTMPPARLRRHRLPPHAGRPIDVLLPQLPAMKRSDARDGRAIDDRPRARRSAAGLHEARRRKGSGSGHVSAKAHRSPDVRSRVPPLRLRRAQARPPRVRRSTTPVLAGLRPFELSLPAGLFSLRIGASRGRGGIHARLQMRTSESIQIPVRRATCFARRRLCA